MIWTILFAASQVTAPEAAPAPTDEIAVTGKRLADTHGAISLNPLTGKRKCKVTATSGNTQIDTAVCEIALKCSKGNTLRPARFRTCVEAERRSFLLAYAETLQDHHAQD